MSKPILQIVDCHEMECISKRLGVSQDTAALMLFLDYQFANLCNEISELRKRIDTLRPFKGVTE